MGGGGIFILLMYLHLGAPRLFVTILYINSGYDRLSYLYMPQYRFAMQLDATRKNSGYESIAAFTLVFNCRYDLLQQGELRPDTEFNPLNPELNPICYLLALLGAHHFLHVSRIIGD